MNDPTSLVELLDKGGTLALLLIIIVGGYRKWWVFGWAYRDKFDEAARWQDIALRALNVGEAAVQRDDARHRYLGDEEIVRRRQPREDER